MRSFSRSATPAVGSGLHFALASAAAPLPSESVYFQGPGVPPLPRTENSLFHIGGLNSKPIEPTGAPGARFAGARGGRGQAGSGRAGASQVGQGRAGPGWAGSGKARQGQLVPDFVR